MDQQVAAKVGRGLKELPSQSCFSGSLMIAWRPDRAHLRMTEVYGDTHHCTPKVRLRKEFDNRMHLHVLRLFTSAESDAVADLATREAPDTDAQSEHAESNGRLSTIPEGSQEPGALSEPASSLMCTSGVI